jgi:hypothetical protein
MEATSLPAAGIWLWCQRRAPGAPSAPVGALAGALGGALVAAAASDAFARLTEAQVTRQAPWPVELRVISVLELTSSFLRMCETCFAAVRRRELRLDPARHKPGNRSSLTCWPPWNLCLSRPLHSGPDRMIPAPRVPGHGLAVSRGDKLSAPDRPAGNGKLVLCLRSTLGAWQYSAFRSVARSRSCPLVQQMRACCPRICLSKYRPTDSWLN